MKLKPLAMSAGLAISVAGLDAAAATLLVDFHGEASSSDTRAVRSKSSDFAKADPAVQKAARPNMIDADTYSDTQGKSASLRGIRVRAELKILSGSGFNASKDNSTGIDGVKILDGYLTSREKAAKVQVSKLEEIPTGRKVTVTVYGLGDKQDQTSAITLTYNGQKSEIKKTAAPQDPAADLAGSYAQFTFVKAAGAHAFTLTAGPGRDQSFASPGLQYGTINGFSLTYAD